MRSVLVVVIYAVLFMDWDTKETPFDGVSFSYLRSILLLLAGWLRSPASLRTMFFARVELT